MQIYLVIGFIYAIYIWLFAGDPWYSIPVNIVGGPFIIVFHYVRFVAGAKPQLKTIFESKKAVVFDLDGTLINSEKLWDEALQEVLKSIGHENVYLDSPDGLGVCAVWKKLLDQKRVVTGKSITELVEIHHNHFVSMAKNLTLTEGFLSLVYELKKEKGFKIGLASNTSRVVVDKMIQQLELEGVFDAVIAGDEVKKRKPSPQMYKKIAKMLNVKPKQMVVFEDSVVGVKAALKSGAGVIVIWLNELNDEIYPRKANMFLSDFRSVTGNLDMTYKEVLAEVAKQAQSQKNDE